MSTQNAPSLFRKDLFFDGLIMRNQLTLPNAFLNSNVPLVQIRGSVVYDVPTNCVYYTNGQQWFSLCNQGITGPPGPTGPCCPGPTGPAGTPGCVCGSGTIVTITGPSLVNITTQPQLATAPFDEASVCGVITAPVCVEQPSFNFCHLRSNQRGGLLLSLNGTFTAGCSGATVSIIQASTNTTIATVALLVGVNDVRLVAPAFTVTPDEYFVQVLLPPICNVTMGPNSAFSATQMSCFPGP
jgi:hypothetical protein